MQNTRALGIAFISLGKPLEWSGDGEDDDDIPDFEAGGGNPYAEDQYAGAARGGLSEDADDDMGEPIG